MQKYLFIVHSSITWRMVRGVIQHEKLAWKDCIILLDRGFKIDQIDGKTYDITDLGIAVFRWQDKARLLKTFRTNRQHFAAINRLLETEIGSGYHLFLPHSWSYTYLALIEHPYCRAYSFIEEGTLAYNRDLSIYDHQPSRARYLALRLLLTACLNASFPVFPRPLQYEHPKYAGCYCISEDAFPSLPRGGRQVLEPPFEVNPEYASIEHILIPGPWIEHRYCNEQQYRTLKTALFQYFVDQGIRQLHVKFHPLQYHRKESMPIFWEIARQFAGQITIVELPAGASPEEIAFSSNADFYLAYSSVTIYAGQFGCKVYSYAKPMYEEWPVFRRVYENLPAVITDRMILLDLKLNQQIV